MFERFTERARQVVVLAQQEAREMNCGFIGVEHILLGVVAEEEGLAAKVLANMGVTLPAVRQSVEPRLTGRKREADDVAGSLPFTPRAKSVLELALREALSLGHNYIGTEHILLAIVREGNNVALEILHSDFAQTPEVIRAEILRMLSGPKPVKNVLPSVLDEPRTSARESLDKLHRACEETISRASLRLMLIEAIETTQRHPYREPKLIADAVMLMNGQAL